MLGAFPIASRPIAAPGLAAPVFATAEALTRSLFLSSRWIDASTVTASSTQGALSANHVQTRDPGQVWRATGCAAESLVWDRGADVATDTLALVGHNLSATAILRLRLASTVADLTTSLAKDSGPVSAWPAAGKPDIDDWPAWLSLLRVANTTGYRYGRLDIFDPLNPDGYVQASRLMAGPAFVPTVNIDLNPALGLVSPDEVGRTAFGRSIGDSRGAPARQLAVPMSSLEEGEVAAQLFELQRYCGLARDFVFVLMPVADSRFHTFALQARFATLAPSQGQPQWHGNGEPVWQATLSLEEVT